MSFKFCAQRRFFMVAKNCQFPIFGQTRKNSFISLPFSDFFRKFAKIIGNFRKSGKTGLQQENPHKNDDFSKIVKKSTLFLKNRFTVDKIDDFFKKCQFSNDFGVFKN